MLLSNLERVGDNGILVSRDGKSLFVNAWGTREIFRVPLSGQGERASVKVDFNPDNLRWDPQGAILATGQFLNPKHMDGLHGWATVLPETRGILARIVSVRLSTAVGSAPTALNRPGAVDPVVTSRAPSRCAGSTDE